MPLYTLVELSASFLESLLVIGTITRISGKRHKNPQHVLLILGAACVMTAIVTCMNMWESFSYLTIVIAATYSIFVTKLTSNGCLLLRTVSCMLTLFFLHTLDYVVGFSVSMIIGQSRDIFHGFELMMETGTIRIIYTVINKSLQVFLFFLLGAQYEKIRQFDKKYLGILLGITTSCYIIMSILLSLIMTDSLFVMQIAIVVSWIFIMSCLVAIITIISIHSKYIKKERETVMISLTNELMERNYQQLHKNQRLIEKQVHDFTNHLKTLKGMLDKDIEAEQYVCKLLAITYRESKLCHSGCDVIDAIINCRISEATAGYIAFTYKVQLPEPIYISSVDICAVLSNQIDNALEACADIPNQQERFVQVTLWQKETFLFFKVVNSVLVNPFIAGNTLISKKKGSGHGLGLINIRDTVEKYDGTLDNQFSGNQFISIAMMQNTI